MNEEIRKKSETIFSSLVSLLNIFANVNLDKAQLTEQNSIIMGSILFRKDSLMFHLELIESIKGQFSQFINEHQIEFLRNKDRGYSEQLFLTGVRLRFLFDDIIFNLCSLLDYLGNLYCYIVRKDSKFLKWNGALDTIRANKAIRLLGSEEKMLSFHEAFADKLYGYRSTLIHKKSDSINVSQNHHFSNDTGLNIDLKVETPEMFIKQFKNCSLLDLTEHDLLKKSSELIFKSFEFAVELIDQIKIDNDDTIKNAV